MRAKSLDRARVIVAEHNRAAIRGQRDQPRIRSQELDALLEMQVPDDRGPQRARRMGERRTAEARDELVGERAAADHGPLLENDRLVTGPGEIERGDQTIVTAADD